MNEDEDIDKLRRQLNQAALSFLSENLEKGVGSGVPKPPTIEIEETEVEPVKLDFLGFGTQGSSTTPTGFGSGFPPPEPSPTGACCDLFGDCTVEGEGECMSHGGIYQGNDTPCDPNPCTPPPSTGACCHPATCDICCQDHLCSIETNTDCVSLGGVYQGDDTLCSPSPCSSSSCNGYSGFMSETGCYCTLTEIFDESCYVTISGVEVGSTLTAQYTTVYNCVGIESNTCDFCNLFTRDSLGNESNCDCCEPGCGNVCTACNALGSGCCTCDYAPDSDTSESCTADTSVGNTTCHIDDHRTISNSCTPVP